MRKMSLFVLLGCVFQISYAQSINYGNYHKVFYDEFEYYDLSTSPPTPDIYGESISIISNDFGIPIGDLFTWHWEITDHPSQVSPTTDGVSSGGAIRITEDEISPGNFVTGVLNTRWYHTINYGIIEAKIRFPVPDPDINKRAAVAFWTYGGPFQKNEIDVVDVATGWVPHRVWDWYYRNYDRPNYGDAYNVSHNSTVGIGDLSTTWHVFSAVIAPDYVSFYIDNIFRTKMTYDEVRIYSEDRILQLVLFPNSNGSPGQFIDIDWVKIWRKNCSADAINIADSTLPSSFGYCRLISDMYKHETITSSSPSCLTQCNNREAVILEAGSTTIYPNFIADESTPYIDSYRVRRGNNIRDTNFSTIIPTMNYQYGPVYKNGFFEILPTNCMNDLTGTGYKTIKLDKPQDMLDSDKSRAYGNRKLTSSYKTASDSDNAENVNAIDNIQDELIQVFPSPAYGKINIAYFGKLAGILKISLKDISGRSVFAEDVVCVENSSIRHTIDISTFAPGVYFVELIHNNRRVIKKIVKL